MGVNPVLPTPSQTLAPRIQTAVLCVGIAFLILLLRLWYMQILEGDRYFSLSTTNRLRVRPVEAPRGFILDRHGEILEENRPTFDLYATLEDVTNPAEVTATLALILGVPAAEIQTRLAEGRERPPPPPPPPQELGERKMGGAGG